MNVSDRRAGAVHRPPYRWATFLVLLACAAVHAQQRAPFHPESCQLDSNPEQIWPTPSEKSALESARAGAGSAAVAENVAFPQVR